MTTVSSVCDKCGAKIPADTRQGVCPACQLETGLSLLIHESVAGRADSGRDDDVGSGDSRKVTRQPRMLGDFGDYEVQEEIGRGGQAVVYRARQKSLNRTVALKVIGLGHWATEAHLKRFRRGAEAAASLEHPCIVPIYEVGERNGSCYFSMQFIDGGQLDEVARREPMPPRRVAELIAKVARTVHHAHERGILHRDIKPGNILLDKNGEPHLTDFGLARLLESESSITDTLDVLGTPSYMAPEQAVGNNAAVSRATDVYGLGAVLYQLLTRHPPFAGATTYETVRLVLDAEPRHPRAWNPKIDRDLATICLKCLDKDPKRRYASALALAEDLERWLKHEPIRAHRSGIFTRGKKWVRRNPSIAVMAAMLLVMTIPLGVMIWKSETEQVSTSNLAAPEKSIAVLPFENLSRDPENTYFAVGIQEEILTRLAGIADLKVISRSSTQHYQSKPRNLRDIAKQLRVANILEGSVQKSGNQVRVDVQLVNAQTDSDLWGDTYDRRFTDILDVESEIAKGITESLQAKLTSREAQALAVKPTSNPEAYDAYLRALAFEAHNYSSSTFWLRDLLGKAIGFYERAVKLDPNFAIAWARLSRANAILYFNAAPRSDSAKRALERAQKLAPNSPETLLALGYYQYRVLLDYGLAKATFGRVSKMLPGSSEVPYALGLIARREGHWDESIAYFEQALTLDPINVTVLITAAETYGMFRQFPAALKLYDRALDITPNDPDMMAGKAGIYQAQGNLQEAAKLLSEINWQTPSLGTFAIKIDQLRLERNYGEVVRLLQARQAQFHFPSQIDKGYNQAELALTQRLAGDIAGAKVTAEQSRTILEQLDRDQPDNVNITSCLSLAYAALGEKDLALKAAERAIMLLPSANDRMIGPQNEENLAFIQTIFGENTSAISTLTRLLQTPYWGWNSSLNPITPALLRLDPIWDPLRGDPRFEKLVEQAREPVALESVAQSAPEKSIAVLPFENLSEEKANEFFADGVQDEILTDLSKVADLKVISRTSVMHYKSGATRNLREIGRQLGVANVVEGSVQRSGNRVRVNAQLIDARNDRHLWAQTYDRDLTDVFAIQSEIAKTIAEQLQAKLSPSERTAIDQAPTTDIAAFDLYIRGKNLIQKSGFSGTAKTDLLKAVDLLNQTVTRDPSFFQGYCQLALAYDGLYARGIDHTSARLTQAEEAIQAAVRLRPDAGETHLARANHLYAGYLDYDRALSELELARQTLPNESEMFAVMGYIHRRQGRWEESTRDLERAVELDPRNVLRLQQIAWANYHYFRRYAEEKSVWDRILAIVPDDVDAKVGRPAVDLDWKADTRPLHQAIDSIRATNPAATQNIANIWLVCALAEHDGTAARNAVIASGENALRLGTDEVAFSRPFIEGVIARMTKDDEKARSAFTAARAEQKKIVQAQPNYGPALCVLSLIDAGLGRKEEALREGRRAVELLPPEKDAVDGPVMIKYLAMIAAWVGDKDLAFEQLAKLIRQPSDLSYGDLKLMPSWDPLRSDPRFERLLEEAKQPVALK
jgi:TolB-like protein/Tfp pilus assembly protein PilF/predicted Ser/Thr protein kinase